MSNNDPMQFDSLSRISIDVSIEGKEYKLYEVNGPAMDIYNKALMSNSQYDTQSEKAMISMSGMVGIESPMLAQCLYKQLDGGKEASVQQKTIQSWPARIRRQLYDRLLEISDLSSDAEDDSKNSPSNTTDGSS